MSLTGRLDELRLALMTLTRLPAGRLAGPAPDMGRAAWAWPLAGALVGALSALVLWGALALGLPPLMAALLAIGTGVVATGALHEDGLADLADGFWGGRDKARRLEIMRDSRVGSYGVLALLLSVGLRVGGIAALAGHPAALIGIAAGSRALMVLPLWLLPPAREDGLGRAAGGLTGPQVAVVLLIGLAIQALFLPDRAILAFALMAVAVLALARLARAKIGGQTGDVLGASQQVAELTGWIVLSAASG
jgi:adenosylcobinamide-GDP ribazoletransferase